jgi:hypothetical protein
MTDIWQAWADGWDAWDAAGAPRPSLDAFRGYDLWRSDVGPWPSVGDAPRPTRLSPAGLLLAELDLTRDDADSALPAELDLTGDDTDRGLPAELDLSNEVFDRRGERSRR